MSQGGLVSYASSQEIKLDDTNVSFERLFDKALSSRVLAESAYANRLVLDNDREALSGRLQRFSGILV
jgi:hypothetical protein